jgi:hypothetical protein
MLPGIQPGDRISTDRLFNSREEDGTHESDLIHDDYQANADTQKINYFDNDEYLNVKISGPDNLQLRIKALVKAYRDIFSTTIPEIPVR